MSFLKVPAFSHNSFDFGDEALSQRLIFHWSFFSRVAVAEAAVLLLVVVGGQGAERAVRLHHGEALRGARRVILDGECRRQQSGMKSCSLSSNALITYQETK